ncbi:hypothetical protein CANTEDRAFT_104515 [Yamadazyma tenuis ATCC 10573]|uniref:NADH dehydrogenase [ubiquinone] 1 alpha subcomplex assembly factor 3 n=1 Tax=Candida tenuis (strain ATCC 10573 / BCRC 21748 / CBS 615 / JCM 9827 / NBRC 10315 / NRRL Y-1498 / VKM Y-70) TaxID=590646 RepID=G3B2D3_CANTC|nr:uncharacterized protein CANTEDRAFT_104515 [Yamadazyma tenuis ATCC 10573]EGV64985.1 hypothetical protein CANTEDRAFT_104515 [Yamadazyma tenuis ATCC 10573]
MYWFNWGNTCDLFGGGKIANPNQQIGAPSGKSETSANPADLFKKNDILMFSTKPINYIESVKPNGFHLSNNLFISSPDTNGDIIGALLVETETYEVNLSKEGFKIINGFLVEFSNDILKVFEKINPKPEILVVGLGKKSRMLSPDNRKYLSSLGIQLEVGDSSHSAQIFDLLSTERPKTIGALLLPPNV